MLVAFANTLLKFKKKKKKCHFLGDVKAEFKTLLISIFFFFLFNKKKQLIKEKNQKKCSKVQKVYKGIPRGDTKNKGGHQKTTPLNPNPTNPQSQQWKGD